MLRNLLWLLGVGCWLLVFAGEARAKTSNGNDLALYYSEAKTSQQKLELLNDAVKRPHFFRYLQVMEMEDHSSGGGGVAITAFEPSSYMDVKFVVTKRVSRQKLKADPATRVGDALAVSGVVKAIENNTIVLSPVIVRHKDRLLPKRGKEMLYEIDGAATFYSFTGGKRPVSLTYKDRDLLQHKSRVMAQGGKQGWCEFLERELAKRQKARAAASKIKKRAP
jgi:hypothetical protein